MILQARHVTYREIETTLGISGTSIHSILYEHLTVKKNLIALDSTQFINRLKKGSCRLVEWNTPKIRSRCFETRLWHRDRNRRFTHMGPKVNSSRLYGCFKMSQIQQKLLTHEVLPIKWSPVFFGKTGHVAIVPLEQRRNVYAEWYTTICLLVVVQEIRETNHNRLRRITLHHDNVNSHTSAQATAFLSTQNIDLMNQSSAV